MKKNSFLHFSCHKFRLENVTRVHTAVPRTALEFPPVVTAAGPVRSCHHSTTNCCPPPSVSPLLFQPKTRLGQTLVAAGDGRITNPSAHPLFAGESRSRLKWCL